MTTTIPKEWTFKTDAIATHFDAHVREQLPWYDLATRAVAHLGRHYIPVDGLVYDIGASTGNIGLALQPTLDTRHAQFIAIDDSDAMRQQYRGPGEYVVADALTYRFEPFDFAVCFLVLMFFSIRERRAWLRALVNKLHYGGAIVIVDKVETPAGYIGSVLRRLAMAWKLESGATADEILAKELSLAGYQRPLARAELEAMGAREFFCFGEFVGWVIEKTDYSL